MSGEMNILSPASDNPETLPRRLSADLRELLRETAGRAVTLGELEQILKGRGFALFLLLLSLLALPLAVSAEYHVDMLHPNSPMANDAYSHFIIGQLFSGLVTYNDNLKIVPDVAATLPSVSQDGKTYTFVLRKGVKFTDGTPVKVVSATGQEKTAAATPVGPRPATPSGILARSR